MASGQVMESEALGLHGRLYTAGRRFIRSSVAVMIDHPVLSSFLIALGARVAFAALSSLLHEGMLIPDEGHYLQLARATLKGELADFWPGYGQSAFESTRTYMWPLVALFWLFGPVRFVGQFFSALLGAVTAAAAASVAGRVLRRSYALVAGLMVALFPSQVLWSSVVLRESLVWAGLACIAAVVGYSQRSSSVIRIVGSALVVGLLFFALATTRLQTSVLALWCMFPALLLGRGRRAVRVLSALFVLAVAPLVIGLGLGGITFAERSISVLGSSHAYSSVSAASSFLVVAGPVATTGPVAVVFQSGSGAACNERVRQELGDEPGSVDEEGLLLDRERQDWMCISDGSGGVILVDNRLRTSLSRIPRGLFDTLVRPLPWETGESNLGKSGAGLESLFWLVLYGLSGYGIWKQREHIALMVFPVLLIVTISVSGAVSHGNLGTAFRHRGQILFALAILSAGGLQVIADRRSGRRLSPIDLDSTEDVLFGET